MWLTKKRKEERKASWKYLEAGAFGGVLLEVEHGFQHFAMATGDETDSTEDLQDGHFHFRLIS